jgi:hypothetical protein
MPNPELFNGIESTLDGPVILASLPVKDIGRQRPGQQVIVLRRKRTRLKQ